MLIFGTDPMLAMVAIMVVSFILGMGGMLYVMLRMLGVLERSYNEHKKTNTGPLTVVHAADPATGPIRRPAEGTRGSGRMQSPRSSEPTR